MTKPLPDQITAEEAGDRLRRAREAIGLEQKDAAQRLGMPQPRLSEIERGKKVPSWTRLLAIVVKLGLNPQIVAPEWFPDEKKRAKKKG